MTKLLFLATEGWFVRSHFLPLVSRAAADGYEVLVAARLGRARDALAAAGARAVDIPAARGRNSPASLARAIAMTRAVLRAERPALVHAIGLKPIMIAGAAQFADAVQVLAVTGRGHLGASARMSAALTLPLLRVSIAQRVRAGRALLAVENGEDRAWVEAGRALPDERVVCLPGAGVDPALFPAAPEPDAPVRIGIAARLVHSKGVDLAVAAFAAARADYPDTELWIAGAPDPENPASVAPAELARWRAIPGVRVLGQVEDMAAFWRGVHVACLASRGGEGLPRSLLEAAACARPIVTTDVAGCRDFVRPGETGFVVAPERPGALAGAFKALLADPALRQRLGANGRARVLAGYTEAHVAALASDLWRRALAARTRT